MGTAAALTAAHAGADAPLHAIYGGCAPADGFDDLGAGDFLALADDLVVLFGDGFSVGVKAGVRLRTQKFRRPSGQQQTQLAGCGEPRRFDADEAVKSGGGVFDTKIVKAVPVFHKGVGAHRPEGDKPTDNPGQFLSFNSGIYRNTQFFIGTNGLIYYRFYTGSWGGWYKITVTSV